MTPSRPGASDLVLDRPVAVKLLRPEYAGHPETLERFRAEAKHAGSLTHPCIARVYDYGNAGPSAPPYLVMEYVNGPSLADMLAVDPVNPVLALDVVAQAAAGLDAARRTAGTRRADHQAHRQGPGGRLANAAELAAVARRLRDILAADAGHTGVASALTGADLEAGADLTPAAGGGMAAGFPDDRSVIAALPVLAAVDLPRLLSGRSPG